MTLYGGYVDAPVDSPDVLAVDIAEYNAQKFMAERPHIEFGVVTIEVLPDSLSGPMKRITWTVHGEEVW